MGTREVQVHDLIGRRVCDPSGASVGRIEEIRAQREVNECYAMEFLVGEFGLFERLAGGALWRSVLRRLPGTYHGYRIAWDQLDLSDPKHPRTTVPRSALTRSDDGDGASKPAGGGSPPDGGQPAPRRGHH